MLPAPNDSNVALRATLSCKKEGVSKSRHALFLFYVGLLVKRIKSCQRLNKSSERYDIFIAQAVPLSKSMSKAVKTAFMQRHGTCLQPFS